MPRAVKPLATRRRPTPTPTRHHPRASIAASLGALDTLALRIAASGDAAAIDDLRREVQHIGDVAERHDLPAIALLAHDLDRRAVRWAAEPASDRDVRAEVIRHTSGALGILLDLAPIVDRLLIPDTL
jgi:hypothetical protein